MRISLIITTYNWKEALELSLKSALEQLELPHEIIVADDGSRTDTGDLVHKIAEQAPIPILHSWQEDRGFRLARSRNKALARASGDYMLLIDGDIVLHPAFVQDHRHVARAGSFVQGGRVLLDVAASERMIASKCVRMGFWSRGLENRKNTLRSWPLAWLCSRCGLSRLSGVRTCNFAFWHEDAVHINGFNEEFEGWGREDSEFTARLMHHGVGRRNIKFAALAYHLHHPENDRQRLSHNDRILQKTIERKSTWCERGLDQYLA